MWKTHLFNIQKDLKKHHRPKAELIEQYVQMRLAKSLQSYYQDLAASAQYLINRNPNNVIRKL
jgi:uncharacterized membrane-anchored protein YhcB (DUF1043 family)